MFVFVMLSTVATLPQRIAKDKAYLWLRIVNINPPIVTAFCGPFFFEYHKVIQEYSSETVKIITSHIGKLRIKARAIPLQAPNPSSLVSIILLS